MRRQYPTSSHSQNDTSKVTFITSQPKLRGVRRVIRDKLLEFLASPIQGLTTPVAAAEQYYANPANDFWKLIGAMLNQTFAGRSYWDKLDLLKANRIGLWDAYHSCIRPGSMDKEITEKALNDSLSGTGQTASVNDGTYEIIRPIFSPGRKGWKFNGGIASRDCHDCGTAKGYGL